MSYGNVALLGLIQGLTEFLPVSSSGHLVIFGALFHLSDPAADNMLLSILLHLGTLVAVCVVYYKDILSLVVEAFRLVRDLCTGKFDRKNISAERRFLLMVLLATVPLVFVIPFRSALEEFFSAVWVVASLLLVTGCMLIWSDRLPDGTVTKGSTKPRHALTVGLFQMMAVLPGISRSGATTTGGLLSGMRRTYAVKFAFILSIPAILGAAVLEAYDFLKAGEAMVDMGPALVGMLVAAVSGVAAIKLINFVVKKKSFKYFGYYCLLAGAATLVYVLL